MSWEEGPEDSEDVTEGPEDSEDVTEGPEDSEDVTEGHENSEEGPEYSEELRCPRRINIEPEVVFVSLPEDNCGDNNFDDPLPELKFSLDKVYNFICKYKNTQSHRYTQLQRTNSHLETENKELEDRLKKSETSLKESEEINRTLVEESEDSVKELEDRLKKSEASLKESEAINKALVDEMRGFKKQYEQVSEKLNKLENPVNLSQEELLKYIKILGKEWEKRITEVEKNQKCVVCFEANKSMLCLPCGHLCLCNTCAEKVKICPLCRSNVTEFKHVYF